MAQLLATRGRLGGAVGLGVGGRLPDLYLSPTGGETALAYGPLLPTRGRLGGAMALAVGGRLPAGGYVSPPEEGMVPAYTAWTDWVCPYCGGPVARWTQGEVPQGWCLHCAGVWGTPGATDGRSFARSVTLPALTAGGEYTAHWGHRAVALTTTGGFSNLVLYHWRPDLYEENDSYLVQSGPGMESNAPRWWAKHPHELPDGKGLGAWDGDATVQYTPGWTLATLSALMGRPLGLAQFKLAFPGGWVAPQDFALEIDCQRADGVIETALAQVRAGTRGPSFMYPLGDVLPLSPTYKLRAEGMSTPYATVSLYQAVTDIRLVAPAEAPGCRCVVTADVPYLATPLGPQVTGQAAAFMALQLAPSGGLHPHIFEDAVGQLFLFRVTEGNIELRRRRSISLPWEQPRIITTDGVSDYPWATKDEKGRMILVRQIGGGYTVVAWSLDDGETWRELG